MFKHKRNVYSISHQQSVYAVCDSRKFKDSNVLFRRNDSREAGVIEKIFLHRRSGPARTRITQAFVVVKVYDRVDGEDRFQSHGDAGGFCCKPNPTVTQLIPLDTVLSHLAVTEVLEEGFVHMLPISRVSVLFFHRVSEVAADACFSRLCCHWRRTSVSNDRLSVVAQEAIHWRYHALLGATYIANPVDSVSLRFRTAPTSWYGHAYFRVLPCNK